MSAPTGESYWASVWRRLKKDSAAVVGMSFAGMLFLVALLAPVLANDKPIVARLDGSTEFPALTTYVDTWVPWVGLRNELKSLEVGGGYPFGDHYAALEGKTWKEAELGFAIWPPVRYSPTQFDGAALKLSPSWEHWLGTDDVGRDVLARMIHGCVVAMLVGIVSMSISATIGITSGLAAGYFGGWVDLVFSRITEIVICFPQFFLIITVIAFLPPSILNIMIVIGLFSWPGMFRLVRGEVLSHREREYVQAAVALGIPRWRIIGVHVLPNAISPAFVTIAFGIAGAILTESGLSFLGFGDPSAPSWGEVVSQGRRYVGQGMWHLAVFPGLAIFVTLTAYNLLGQALRDAMDPKLSGR
ncbi:MAG: ABC transporter permease [Myxococcota bacterium]